jgi:hypothetical protein
MAFREVSVVEVREVLRAWLSGVGLRTVGERAGVDRKTARYAELGITGTMPTGPLCRAGPAGAGRPTVPAPPTRHNAGVVRGC